MLHSLFSSRNSVVLIAQAGVPMPEDFLRVTGA